MNPAENEGIRGMFFEGAPNGRVKRLWETPACGVADLRGFSIDPMQRSATTELLQRLANVRSPSDVRFLIWICRRFVLDLAMRACRSFSKCRDRNPGAVLRRKEPVQPCIFRSSTYGSAKLIQRAIFR